MSPDISEKVDIFFRPYKLQKYPKGKVLILHNDEPDNIYYLVKGKVKQYDITSRGDEIILNIFKPGSFFPMSLAINKTPSLYIFETETAVEVRLAPINEVVEFIQQNPDVMFDLLARLYRGMDGVLGRMNHLMSSSAGSRLTYELLLEAQRFGETMTDGSVVMKITESELAARAGLTRETVSREINKLKTHQIVAINSGTITIKSVSELHDTMNA